MASLPNIAEEIRVLLHKAENELMAKQEAYLVQAWEASGLPLDEFVKEYTIERSPVVTRPSYGTHLELSFRPNEYTMTIEQEIRVRRKTPEEKAWDEFGTKLKLVLVTGSSMIYSYEHYRLYYSDAHEWQIADDGGWYDGTYHSAREAVTAAETQSRA